MLNENIRIMVLDDDPTGTQTVYDVFVYTCWDVDTLEEALLESTGMFYVLTNTRSLPASEAAAINREIARNLLEAKRRTGKDVLVISRSDSTLRGHYPLETQVLFDELGGGYDGEVIAPCFFEGGRVTSGNIHYAIQNGTPVPVGETEFAKDATFGFRHSHLGEWVEEKTGGRYARSQCVFLAPDEAPDMLAQKLEAAADFQKIIVNAANEQELQVCVDALEKARQKGKRFLYRTAASFPRTLAGWKPRPPLDADRLVRRASSAGGLVMVGSYTKKTTAQLDSLLACFPQANSILFHSEQVLFPGGLAREAQRVCRLASESIASGQLTVVFTQRAPLGHGQGEKALAHSVQIADAFASVVAQLQARPRFLIAKGGITSSKIATDALRIRKALVLGQAAPGIPVWLTGEESRFPEMPYIIFPGNVGERETLTGVCQTLLNQSQ